MSRYVFLFVVLEKNKCWLGAKKPPKKRPNTLKRVLGTFFTTRGWCALAWGQVFHFVQALVTCWHTSLREKLVKDTRYFAHIKKQRGNDKACSLIFITFKKSKTKRTTASRITFRPFHFTLSTPCCVLFAPRLASLSSSSVHVWRTYSPLPPLNTHYSTHLCTFSPTTTPCSKMFVPHIFCAFITRH